MKLNLLDHKELKSFPSGSGIEFFDGKIYIVGDDATDILVTNRRWKMQNEIRLLDSEEKRISEKPRADLEAATILELDKKNLLLVMYSGSKELRKKGVLVDLKTNEISEFDYSVFYERLKTSGISDLNIEGAVQVHEFLIFCNRVNHTNPANQLIITSPDFFRSQQDAPIELLDIDLSAYDGTIAVSGLTYSYEHDQLIFTTTTEDTVASKADVSIVKSYLGLLKMDIAKSGGIR